MELIERGEKAGLIRFDEGRKFITYVIAGKRQRYSPPVRRRARARLMVDS